jgi:hypothetical protein
VRHGGRWRINVAQRYPSKTYFNNLLGLIEKKLGGLVQTNIGYLRVAKGQLGTP